MNQQSYGTHAAVPDLQTTGFRQTQGEKPVGEYAPVSTGAFFGYKLLYGIPVVGWILCLIFSFTEKNVNKRNFARATLLALVLSLVVTCLLGLAVVKAAEVVVERVAVEILDGTLGDVGILEEVVDELQAGKHDVLLARIKSGEFGEFSALSRMLEMLREKGLMAVLTQIQNGGFQEVLDDFANGKYNAFIDRANSGEFGELGALGRFFAQLGDGSSIEGMIP